MKKVIGLTGVSEFTQECIDTIETFFEANFVMLFHNNLENLNKWLDEVDGVILAGGVDIHPSLYNCSIWTGNNLSRFDIKRDIREIQIVDYCFKNRKPMLGICRGHQIISIKLGLGFIMDITDSSTCHNTKKHNISTSTKEPVHYVNLTNPDSFYEEFKCPYPVDERKLLSYVLKDDKLVEGKSKIWVNSYHHQAIPFQSKRRYDKENIKIIGTSRVDLVNVPEIIEIMEGTYKDPHWISVQWHPEVDWMENTYSRCVLSRFKSMLM